MISDSVLLAVVHHFILRGDVMHRLLVEFPGRTCPTCRVKKPKGNRSPEATGANPTLQGPLAGMDPQMEGEGVLVIEFLKRRIK